MKVHSMKGLYLTKIIENQCIYYHFLMLLVQITANKAPTSDIFVIGDALHQLFYLLRTV